MRRKHNNKMERGIKKRPAVTFNKETRIRKNYSI